MEDLNDKITGGNLSATEWNEVPSELQNVIEQLGHTLSAGDLNQLGKAIAGYGASGDFYTGGGTADAQTLTKIGTKQAPAFLTDGMRVRWRPSVNNTGAATINVNALGVKSIVLEDASALAAGDLSTTRDALARYDLANDRFVLANYVREAAVPSLRGYISGFTLSRTSATILTVGAGSCISEDSARRTLTLTAPETIDVTDQPTGGAGGLQDARATDTWYHVYAIRQTAGGAIDVYAETAYPPADVPAGYDSYRRLGSFRLNATGSGEITAFVQYGDTFLWDAPPLDVDTTQGTTSALHPLTVPPAIIVKAMLNTFSANTTNSSAVLISAPGVADANPSLTATPLATTFQNPNGSGTATGGGPVEVYTDTSRQVRADATHASTTFRVATLGWIDPRGKDV
jgi:hypothetical protein